MLINFCLDEDFNNEWSKISEYSVEYFVEYSLWDVKRGSQKVLIRVSLEYSRDQFKRVFTIRFHF